MKYFLIMLVLISSAFAQSVDPSSYSTYNDFFNALKSANANWLDSLADRTNVIEKDFSTTEPIKSEHINSKMNALSKNSTKVSLTMRLSGNTNAGEIELFFAQDQINTNPSAVVNSTYVIPKSSTYVMGVTLVSKDGAPLAIIKKNGVTIKTHDGTSGNAGNAYSWITNYEVELLQGDVITIHRDATTPYALVGSFSITEKN